MSLCTALTLVPTVTMLNYNHYKILMLSSRRWSSWCFPSPATPGTDPASSCAAPRPSPGLPSRGPKPPVSPGSQDWRSDHVPAAVAQTAQRPGKFQHGRRSRSCAPAEDRETVYVMWLMRPRGFLWEDVYRVQYLVSLQQCFSSGHVLGELIGRHQSADTVDPGHQIPAGVTQE